jgi:Tol biopolymer transport system component
MLAYQGFGSRDHRNIFVKDLSTGGVRQLTHERHDVSELSWSDDGERILYSTTIHGDLSANVFDNGASSVLKIVDVATGRVQKMAGTHRSAADFGTWSRDGEQIAYMTGHEWTDNAYGFNPAEIWVMGADGANAHRLVTLDTRSFGLVWTPDGNLSFSEENGDTFATYELDVETGQIRRVAAGSMPAWLDAHTVIVGR